MPIYEYGCEKCGEVFEVMQKISDKPLTTHKDDEKKCGGKLTKLMSSNAFHLKGGGWFKDGYSKAPPEKKKETASAATPPCATTGSCPAAKN